MNKNMTSRVIERMSKMAKTHKGPDIQKVAAIAICQKYQRMEEALQRINDASVPYAWSIAEEALLFDPLSDQ